jgi:hypothetical protein
MVECSDFGGFRQISIFDFQFVAKNFRRMNKVLQILAIFCENYFEKKNILAEISLLF